jgi:hypothetical protein
VRTDIDHSGIECVCNYAGRHDFICNGLGVGLDSDPAKAGPIRSRRQPRHPKGLSWANVSRSGMTAVQISQSVFEG